MKWILLSLFFVGVLGVDVVVRPNGYYSESSLLAGIQVMSYKINSNQPISVLVLDPYQYHQFIEGKNPLVWNECSRFSVTSIDSTCEYYVRFEAELTHFVLMNEGAVTANVSYTLKYTSSLSVLGITLAVILSLFLLIFVGVGGYLIIRRSKGNYLNPV